MSDTSDRDLNWGRLFLDSVLAPLRSWSLFFPLAVVVSLLMALVLDQSFEASKQMVEASGSEAADASVSTPAFWLANIVLGFVHLVLFVLFARLGVMGDDRAWRMSPWDWTKRLFQTFINFMIVSIVITIASVVFGGLAGAVSTILPLAAFVIGIAGLVGLCAIYAWFSFTFVEGVLGERYVSSTLPSRALRWGLMPFSLVLGGLVLVAVGLLGLAILAGGESLLALSVLLFAPLYGTATLGVAHGRCFHLKTGRSGTRAEEIEMAARSTQ